MLETKRLILRLWQESDGKLLNEKRTGHTSLLTRENWEKENKHG